MLAEAASLTGQPVLLEDLGHRALSFAVGDVPAATVMKDWTARSRQGARGLLWQLRYDAGALSFVDAQLGPLLALEEAARGTMLRMLLAYLGAGGVVTEFACAVRLRALLGCDLEQPRTRLSLHLALLGLNQEADVAPRAAPTGGPWIARLTGEHDVGAAAHARKHWWVTS